MEGKLGTPFANIQVAQEYLATAQSNVQFRSRLWQVAEDTVTINAMCEFGGNVGSFSAGAMSNKIAHNYMDEMVETELTKNLNQELNRRIFRTTAEAGNRDPNTVRGTGTLRQNVPEYMRGDICNRPERNERPPEWGNNGGSDEEGLGSSGPLEPGGPPNSGSSSDSMGPSTELGYKQDIPPNRIDSDEDDRSGRIFAKCFGWLGFGDGGGIGSNQCLDPAPMSAYDAEQLREEREKDLYMGSPTYVNIENLNPPMCFPNIMLPPDK